jgi:hypothetical protein
MSLRDISLLRLFLIRIRTSSPGITLLKCWIIRPLQIKGILLYINIHLKHLLLVLLVASPVDTEERGKLSSPVDKVNIAL